MIAMLPTAPLRRRLEEMDEDQRMAVLERAGYTAHRWCTSGLRKALMRSRITVWLADRVCIALGLHPSQVYGQAWYAEGVAA